MPQTVKFPVGALKAVSPDEIAITITSDESAMTPERMAEIETKYRSEEKPLMFSLDQLKTEPPPDAPASTIGDRFSNAMGAGSLIGGTVGALAGGIPGAAVGGAAGEGYQQLYRHAKEIPGAIADVTRNLIEQPTATLRGFGEGVEEGKQDVAAAAGVNAGMEAGGQLAMNALGGAAKSVYRGYLKPSLAGASIKKAQQIVDTALAEALPITKSGVAKASAAIDELKSEVDRILVRQQGLSKATHGDIDLHDVAERVRQFARDKYYKAGRPVEDFEQALKVADNIDAHPSLNLPPGQAPGPLPVDLTTANVTKRTLGESAGERAFGVERTATQEAEKFGYRDLRLQLEKRAADIAPLNAREKKLIDAAKAIGHAVEREANQNALVGVKSVLSAGAGGLEYQRTGDPYTAAAKALAVRMLLTPEVASRLAIVAYKIGTKLHGVAPASAARLAIAAFMNDSGDEESQ